MTAIFSVQMFNTILNVVTVIWMIFVIPRCSQIKALEDRIKHLEGM